MKFKNKICAVLFTMTVAIVGAQEKKASSPAETAQGKFKGATVTINYGSPSVKGREIWGGLVPFGKIWRAGANDATTIETDKDLTVEGKTLPAGKYSIFIIPEKDNATVIFNKVAKQWGAYDYNEKEDVLRVKVKPVPSKEKTEKLIYKFNKDNITLSWDNWNIPISVK
ncbi:MAG: DUF2911 domain-containing protein [Flavobacterium sp.]|nr:MAG: DUF2911 domain-containing protein [Flavobacterium sp.]